MILLSKGTILYIPVDTAENKAVAAFCNAMIATGLNYGARLPVDAWVLSTARVFTIVKDCV